MVYDAPAPEQLRQQRREAVWHRAEWTQRCPLLYHQNACMPFHLAEDTWKMSLEGMYVISFGRRDSRYDRGEGPCGKKMTLDHSNGHYLTTSLKKTITGSQSTIQKDGSLGETSLMLLILKTEEGARCGSTQL